MSNSSVRVEESGYGSGTWYLLIVGCDGEVEAGAGDGDFRDRSNGDVQFGAFVASQNDTEPD